MAHPTCDTIAPLFAPWLGNGRSHAYLDSGSALRDSHPAKNPGFTAIAILTLALGIGANTAIFSVVNGVLLRPLPFRDPSRLVLIAEKSSFPVISTSYENYLDWRDQSHSFESMEATRGRRHHTDGRGRTRATQCSYGHGGPFSDAGNQRADRPDFSRGGGSCRRRAGRRAQLRLMAAALRRLAEKSSARPINLDSQPYTVVGVLPSGFQILQPADVFLPFMPWARTLPDDRNWHPGIIPLARLKPGVSREQARVEMVGITKRLEQQYPDYNTGTSADVVGLQDQIVQNSRPALLLLLGAVSFVLLIACVNVANLLLARAASRGREVAIRTAMGAGRGRVIRQLLTESVLLSLGGGLLGVSHGLGFAWTIAQDCRRQRAAGRADWVGSGRARFYRGSFVVHRIALRNRSGASHRQAGFARSSQRGFARLDGRAGPASCFAARWSRWKLRSRCCCSLGLDCFCGAFPATRSSAGFSARSSSRRGYSAVADGLCKAARIAISFSIVSSSAPGRFPAFARPLRHRFFR